jgi:hypothetical protein
MLWLMLAATNKYNIPATDIGLPHTTQTISAGLSAFLEAAVGLVGGLALIFLIFGGFIMVISAGNPSRFERGRETVLYAVVGIVVAMAAYAIVFFVSGAANGGL